VATAPEPLRDLDWDPQRARSLGERALGVWEELLRDLPSLPVSRDRTAAEVREAVALPIPDEPLSETEIEAHLRALVLEHATYSGHPDSSPTS
jgi:hypothetical protein